MATTKSTPAAILRRLESAIAKEKKKLEKVREKQAIKKKIESKRKELTSLKSRKK